MAAPVTRPVSVQWVGQRTEQPGSSSGTAKEGSPRSPAMLYCSLVCSGPMCRVCGMQGARELEVPKSLMVQLVAAPGADWACENRLAPAATRDWGHASRFLSREAWDEVGKAHAILAEFNGGMFHLLKLNSVTADNLPTNGE